MRPPDDARRPLHFLRTQAATTAADPCVSRREGMRSSREAHTIPGQNHKCHHPSHIFPTYRRKVVHDHVRVPSRRTQSQQLSFVPATTFRRGCRARPGQNARRRHESTVSTRSTAAAPRSRRHQPPDAQTGRARKPTVADADVPPVATTSSLPLQQSRLAACGTTTT